MRIGWQDDRFSIDLMEKSDGRRSITTTQLMGVHNDINQINICLLQDMMNHRFRFAKDSVHTKVLKGFKKLLMIEEILYLY